ncbi:MAG TPA: helix-turn-helix transcriptional regulator [Leadbetterella sp.]|nr:helix-turn-helix transcriptional regulator [Leadbetterella sp.]
MSNDELGTLIQKYRKAHKLSQTEFAVLFGVSQPTVGSWETGFSGPYGSKRDDIVKLVSGKKEETKNESEQLHEIIRHQKTIIELLKDKIKGLGGSV